MASVIHRPVLLVQVVEALAPGRGGLIVDATVGLGGHAHALLGACADVRLLGLDLDPTALALAREKLAPFADRVELVESSYRDLATLLAQRGETQVRGVLFDLGVSSLQLDTPSRGFSFRHDAPLDMRFALRGMTAAELLSTLGEDELVKILRAYGEEPRARRVARAIVRAQTRAPIRTTGELHRIVAGALPVVHRGIDPATRTFQALRIVTNRELEDLPVALEQAAHLLAPGGRLAVIAFHSLEDRLVKHTLRRLSGRCVCPPGVTTCECRPERLLEVITRRPLRPDEAEIAQNPRARSARLRVAERRRP
jgi:16S rRNA (cytosine1402-N4)-methyltransferase